MTIYLVEDETNIRELVVYTLRATGYEAEGYAEGESFFAALENELPDMVLLDIMLPGEDGLSILQKLREDPRTATLPIIMITAKDSEYDKVVGLDGGADDYVTKPFGMMELVSRIKAVWRRSGGAEKQSHKLQSGPVELNCENYTVKVKGQPVTLTLKEFDLLRLLMENTDMVLGRDQILERVWGYNYEGETRTVDVHIRSLRIKLGEGGEIIETVRGVGYRIGASA